jgi:hypothetical protein
MVSCVRGLSSRDVVVGGVIREGWWSVVDEKDSSDRILAGPFPDRAEAAWAAASSQEGAVAVYGARRDDGTLARRPSPQDWAWLAHLAEQLERLPDDWDMGFSEEDPLVTLVVEVTAALAESGLTVHDAAGTGSEAGGACLIPEPALGGIVVTWRQHDRMGLDQVHGADIDGALQQVMNRAVGDVLTLRGFSVEVFGQGSGHVVRSSPGI